MRTLSRKSLLILMSLVLAVGLCPGLALAEEGEGEEAEEAATPDVQMLVASGDAGGADEGASMGAESDMDAQAGVTWKRIAGQEALDTMEKIVNAGWKGTTGGTVVLTTDSGYWDALTAAGAAGFTNAPVLMTAPKSLSPQTQRLLKQLKPKRIVICGGTAVVSKAVEKAAASAAGGATVKRFWGQTMTDTADEIFKGAASYSGGTWSRTAFVATSNGYWDALSAAPISYRKHMPIFLTETKDGLSASTIKAMRGKIDKVVIVGGKAVVSEAVEEQLKAAGIKVDRRLGGKTAIDTSVLVANYGVSLGMTADSIGIATQNGYWDALSGAALCGKKNSVLVLVDDEKSSSISGFVGKHKSEMSTGYVFGGKYAVTDATLSKLKTTTNPKSAKQKALEANPTVVRVNSSTGSSNYVKITGVVDVQKGVERGAQDTVKDVTMLRLPKKITFYGSKIASVEESIIILPSEFAYLKGKTVQFNLSMHDSVSAWMASAQYSCILSSGSVVQVFD